MRLFSNFTYPKNIRILPLTLSPHKSYFREPLTFTALANIGRNAPPVNARFLALWYTLGLVLPIQLIAFVTNTPLRSRTNTILTGFTALRLAQSTLLANLKTIPATTNPGTHAIPVETPVRTVRFARSILSLSIQLITHADSRCNALPVDAVHTAHRSAFAFLILVAIVALADFRLSAKAVGAIHALADRFAFLLIVQLVAFFALTRLRGNAILATSGADGLAQEWEHRG